MFVSGGIDGRIILWEITNNESNKMNFEKFYEYNISHEELSKRIEDPKNHIQSLCIVSKYILAGTKSGDIYEIEIPDESEQKQVTKYTQDMVQLRMSCHDHDIPKAVAFSPNSDKLFSITKNGILSVWDLKTLNRESTKYFAKETLNMIVCKSSKKIIIAFEKEVALIIFYYFTSYIL